MSSKPDTAAPASRNVGSQTLARGLRALEIVAASPEPVSIQEVADRLAVHRTIAYRILSTLGDFHLVTRTTEGRYRAGAGLTALAHHVQDGLHEVAVPLLRELAAEIGATVALLVEEADEAVAIAVIEPPVAGFHLTFRTGSRHPLHLGAAGLALQAARPASLGEPDEVSLARGRGYALTQGEVEPGAYGVAAPLARPAGAPGACVNVITNREDIARGCVPALLAVVRRLDDALR